MANNIDISDRRIDWQTNTYTGTRWSLHAHYYKRYSRKHRSFISSNQSRIWAVHWNQDM